MSKTSATLVRLPSLVLCRPSRALGVAGRLRFGRKLLRSSRPERLHPESRAQTRRRPRSPPPIRAKRCRSCRSPRKDINCPEVDIAEGGAAYRVGGADNASVRYQFNIGDTARAVRSRRAGAGVVEDRRGGRGGDRTGRRRGDVQRSAAASPSPAKPTRSRSSPRPTRSRRPPTASQPAPSGS